jgi:hypothetical protein
MAVPEHDDVVDLLFVIIEKAADRTNQDLPSQPSIVHTRPSRQQ